MEEQQRAQERLEQERQEEQRREQEAQEKIERDRMEEQQRAQERLEQERQEEQRRKQEMKEQEQMELKRQERDKEEQDELSAARQQEQRREQDSLDLECQQQKDLEIAERNEQEEPQAERELDGSKAQKQGADEANNKALTLLSEYQARVKAIYEQHNPDKVAEVDQILGKYREQIMSRPDDCNNEQVLARYRERLQSLYKAVCAKYDITLADDKEGATGASFEVYANEINAIYREHNPAKLGEVDKLMDKYSSQLGVLYQSICHKYNVDPLPHLLPEESRSPTSTSTEQNSAGKATGPAVIPAEREDTFGMAFGGTASNESSTSVWSTGFLSSGLQTLKSLHGAAEGIGKQLERQFDEAIRSEEDISTAQVMEGLSRAAEKGALHTETAKWDDLVAVSEPLEASFSGDVQPGAPLVAPSEEDQEVSNSGPAAAQQPQKFITAHVQQQFEAWQAEKERLLREAKGLRTEKENLIAEGTKMSRRVQAVEERMKAMTAEARRYEAQIADLEKAREAAQVQLSRMTARAEKAETQCNEQRGEVRRLAGELEKSRHQIQGEKRQLQADQQALQWRARDQSEKERKLEERLQSISLERDELRATSSSLSLELQQAMTATDAAERRLQLQQQEIDQLQEQHRRRLEAAEIEFASESVPAQQRIGELEAQMAHQERKLIEREAAAYRERDKERAELEAAKEELRQRELLQDRRARELREESERAQRATAQAAEARRMMEEAESSRESADRAREAAEGELKLENARRRSTEQKLVDVQRQVETLQAAATLRPALSPMATTGDSELKIQVQALTQQRDALQEESQQLRRRLEAQQRSQVESPAYIALAQKFELALQAIGKLQEELEISQRQRDSMEATVRSGHQS
eukprot:TRINITY_DN29108_c0_g1_i4.p1 TRINITY_DN29108_c0_g1~~TRINITY_DN29108_c0_g1_i4.p1  ORF type:complete len:876 (+),score=272.54 TRINITY_DN29108_c0_g1_i4:1880-4507(+)